MRIAKCYFGQNALPQFSVTPVRSTRQGLNVS